MLLRNSLAHLTARVSTLGAGIIAIPLVTMTLGTEALGLVGIYATLQAMLGLFDLGLPVVANHRLAIMIGRNAVPVQQAVMVRTIEVLFWGLAAIFLFLGLALHGPLAASWLKIMLLPRSTVETALVLMIAAAAIRFPVAFYSNVLFAYDRHVYPNAVTSIAAVLRITGALIALIVFDVGIVGYFVIQLAGSLAEIAFLIAGVWLAQPHCWVRPQLAVLRNTAKLAGGLTLVSLTAVALSQIDKVILSKALALGDFGLYSAGYTLAAGLVALSYPVGNAIFPRLSRSLDGNSQEATRLVHAATELTILIIVPLSCVMIMQTAPVLELLFLAKPGPSALVNILPLMMLGGIAQGFVTLPHLFQVAAGRVATVVWINVAFIVPYAALILIAAQARGVQGAAVVFAVFNFARLLTYWGVLGGTRRTALIWRPAMALTIAATAGGLVLASAPLLFEVHGLVAILIAVLSVPALIALAALAMPISRKRLVTLRRAWGGRR